jgi:ABC-type polysaccharide transport system permease subunit
MCDFCVFIHFSTLLPTVSDTILTLIFSLERKVAMHMKLLHRDLKYDWILYLMLVPGIISLLLFSYGPMFGLSVAFLNYNPILGVAKSQFVGLSNFSDALGNTLFWKALRNTILIKLGQTLLTFPCSILLALLLNEARPWVKKVLQTSTIMPFFVSWVVVAVIFSNLLSPTSGLVNELLSLFGAKKPIAFLSSND